MFKSFELSRVPRAERWQPETPCPPSPRAKVPLMPVGGGVVGAGVVGLLDRMRRVQQRHRNEGAYIRLPDQSQSQFEQRLRLGEGREVIHAVDAALRLLEQAWGDPELGPPR